MQRTATSTAKRHSTDHPHVVRDPAILAGKPTIRGTRIPVWIIAERYRTGDSVEEVLAAYPHLGASQVHDAISYYLDHRAETEDELGRQTSAALSRAFKLRRIADGVDRVLGPRARPHRR